MEWGKGFEFQEEGCILILSRRGVWHRMDILLDGEEGD